MSIRKERFCDFMVEPKADIMGNIPKATETCINRATDKCFFCKRDYCRTHADSSYHQLSLGLTGFKQDFVKVLPRCKLCEMDHLPYNPEDYVLKHFERCWRGVRRTIRAEKKATRTKAEAAKAARAAAKAEMEQKAKEAVAQPKPEAEVAEATEATEATEAKL